MIQDWGVTYDDLEPSTRNSRRLAVEISGFAAGADQYQILGDCEHYQGQVARTRLTGCHEGRFLYRSIIRDQNR
jgi:hypothetical protein